MNLSGLSAARLIRASVIFLFMGLSQTSLAVSITLAASDRGWYRDDGLHLAPDELNFLTGHCAALCGPLDAHHTFRSFFSFDLSAVTAPITSASFKAFNPENGFLSVDAFETLSIFDVSTESSSIFAGTAGMAAFIDLGTGIEFGQTQVSNADNNSTVEVVLNSQGLGALNSTVNNFVLGASISSLSGADLNEFVFAFSNSTDSPLATTQLVVQTAPVPVPGAFGLLMLGLLSLLGLQWPFSRRIKI